MRLLLLTGYGKGWNREHLWPQSLMQAKAKSNDMPATDMHALRAADISCNGYRGNLVFGSVPVGTPARADCPLLICEGSVCEPDDTIKGEIARALMYIWPCATTGRMTSRHRLAPRTGSISGWQILLLAARRC